VFSSSVLHWCKRDPAGVLESAKKVLKKGGRFVGEMGGFMNCIGPTFNIPLPPSLDCQPAGVRMALQHVLRSRGYDPTPRDPWFFPSMEDYVKVWRIGTNTHPESCSSWI